MQEKLYAVYILTNPAHTVLYTGFTSNLARRVYEHKEKLVEGFTKKYNCNMVIYYELGEDYNGVLAREKEIKGWTRKKKEDLIGTVNPDWNDLHEQIT